MITGQMLKLCVDTAKEIYQVPALGKSSAADYVDARRAIYAVLYNEGYTHQEISKVVYRSRPTVAHALQSHLNLLRVQPDYKRRFQQFVKFPLCNDTEKVFLKLYLFKI
ncbi:hypothetical protein ACLI1A_10270 [Flavobacterium sp. RHBU_3]|uniref:hypothetical protein n=1 Tax=Flavobacterium sp. RHBU_3 TaxID=3391184 RepID=UPI003985417D